MFWFKAVQNGLSNFGGTLRMNCRTGIEYSQVWGTIDLGGTFSGRNSAGWQGSARCQAGRDRFSGSLNFEIGQKTEQKQEN
jgi:hypothetical protein